MFLLPDTLLVKSDVISAGIKLSQEIGMGVDSCSIYGLESQGRALCSHLGDQDAIRFYVGTLSPRSEGQLHQIDFDEETNHITRKIYKPKVGEIWQLQCSPSHTNLIALTYNDIKENSANFCGGIWELPDPKLSESNQEMKALYKFDDEDIPGQDVKCVDWNTSKPGRLAVVYDEGFKVWDLKDGGTPQGHSTFQIFPTSNELVSSGTNKGPEVYMGKWNPHLDGNQFSLLRGSSVKGIDIRSMQLVWEFSSAHKFQVRDIDFNPNKQYYFATCGDDCASRFWDIRKPNECLKEVCEHSHWVWRIRYNLSHDQLVLTSGSDSRVVLHALPSISSEPSGHMIYTELDEGEEGEGPTPQRENKLEEGVLAKYEDHEDAVYATEWSSYDPWIFASLSYDGRLVINKVSESQKYKILL